MNQGSYRLLHVGCGHYTQADLPPPFSQPPWQEIRLDIDPGTRPDILASITDLSAVPSHSVQAVWSSHNLEHLYAHEVPRALSEFARVLAPAGFVVITLPNLTAVAEAILKVGLTKPVQDTPAGAVTPLDMLYGYRPFLERGNPFMGHRTGFTAESLTEALRGAGFAGIATVASANSWYLWSVASLNGADAQQAHQLALKLADRATAAA
jgi:SAM-dependent methyltransferase